MVKLVSEPINPIKMRRSRRKFSAKFKSTVVLEVLMEQKTISEPAQQFEVHPNEISIWKREFLDNAEATFGNDLQYLGLGKIRFSYGFSK